MTVVFSGIWMLRLHLYLQLPLLHVFLLKHIIHVEIIQQHGVLNRCVRCERPVILNPAVVMDPTMKGHPKLVGAEPVSSSKETMVIVTSYEKNRKKMFLTGANQKIAGDFSCIFQVGPAKNTSFNRQVGPDRRKHRWQNFARFSWGKHMISIWGFP